MAATVDSPASVRVERGEKRQEEGLRKDPSADNGTWEGKVKKDPC